MQKIAYVLNKVLNTELRGFAIATSLRNWSKSKNFVRRGTLTKSVGTVDRTPKIDYYPIGSKGCSTSEWPVACFGKFMNWGRKVSIWSLAIGLTSCAMELFKPSCYDFRAEWIVYSATIANEVTSSFGKVYNQVPKSCYVCPNNVLHYVQLNFLTTTSMPI